MSKFFYRPLISSIALAALLSLTGPISSSSPCDEDAQVTAFKRALKADKKNVKTIYNLGIAYFQAGQAGSAECFENAIETFQKAIKTNKKDKAAHREVDGDSNAILGDLYYEVRKDDKKAVEFYKKALKFNASNSATLLGIGLSLSRQGKYAESSQYLRKAAIVEPDSAKVHYRLAEALFFQLDAAGDKADPKLFQDTRDEYAKVAQLAKGKNAQANANILYVSYTRLGMMAITAKEKIKWFKKVIKIDPMDLNAHYQLGLQYHKLKKYADMVSHYEQAVKIKPDHALALFNLAVAYINQGDAYKAYKAFNTITELPNPDPPGIVNEALVLKAQTLQKAIDDNMSKGVQSFTAEKFGQALKHFEIVRKISPKNKDAKRYEKESIDAVEKNFKAYVKNAASLHKSKRHTDALDEIEKAMDLNITSIHNIPRLKEELAEDVSHAKKLRKQIMRKISGLVDIYMQNGRSAERRGDFEIAKREYTKARRFKRGKKAAGAALASLKKKFRSAFNILLSKASRAEKKGDLISAKRLYAQAKRDNSKSKKAVDGLTRVNNAITKRIKRYNAKGEKLYAAGKKKDAQKQFELTLGLDPDDKSANEYVQRITGSQSTAKLNKQETKKLYYQGVDFYVNNKIKKAIRIWEKLLKIDPNHADARANIKRAKAKLVAIQKLKGT